MQRATAERLEAMAREKLQLTMKAKLRDMKARRQGRVSSKQRAELDAREEAARERAEATFDAREEGDNNTASTEHVDESMEETQARSDVLMQKVVRRVKAAMAWCWALMRPAYLESPQVVAPLQFRFVLPHHEQFKQTYLSILIVVIRGSVWGFATDELGGLAEMIANDNGRLVCLPSQCMERLPDDPHFSKALAKCKDALVLRDIRVADIPFFRPPFWNTDTMNIAFVDKDLLGVDAFNAAYPTVEARMALMTETRAAKQYIDDNITKWREQDEVEGAKMQRVRDGIAKGQSVADLVMAEAEAKPVAAAAASNNA